MKRNRLTEKERKKNVRTKIKKEILKGQSKEGLCPKSLNIKIYSKEN